jgi:hypothetical protein
MHKVIREYATVLFLYTFDLLLLRLSPQSSVLSPYDILLADSRDDLNAMREGSDGPEE